jgi:hypothetical protein
MGEGVHIRHSEGVPVKYIYRETVVG